MPRARKAEIGYNNTMSDLLGITDDYGRDLPPDSVSHDGFKNNGATLGITDMQLEIYLKAARDALAGVIVAGPEPQVFKERFTETFTDKGHGPYADTLGRTGIFVVSMKEFPKRGDFIVRIKARGILHPDMGYPQLSVNVGYRSDVHAPFKELARTDVTSNELQTFEYRGRLEKFPQSVRTGSRYSGLKIWLRNVYNDGTEPESTEPFRVPTAQIKMPIRTVDPEAYLTFPQIKIESVEFEGPIYTQWPAEQYRAILFDSPLREEDEAAYAREVISRFLARAFRRPVEPDEVTTYFSYYKTVRAHADSLESAICEALSMVLVSSDFLYLVEAGAAEGKRPLNDHELAARLSYFLTISMPDTELRQLADEGKLTDPEELRRQIRRLLASERSDRFVDQFTDQWLDLGAMDRVAINPEYYPNFDACPQSGHASRDPIVFRRAAA